MNVMQQLQADWDAAEAVAPGSQPDPRPTWGRALAAALLLYAAIAAFVLCVVAFAPGPHG